MTVNSIGENTCNVFAPNFVITRLSDLILRRAESEFHECRAENKREPERDNVGNVRYTNSGWQYLWKRQRETPRHSSEDTTLTYFSD
jgi:hypothetical protein